MLAAATAVVPTWEECETDGRAHVVQSQVLNMNLVFSIVYIAAKLLFKKAAEGS
jgi:hypothetical protein